jgi:hypothetical protein
MDDQYPVPVESDDQLLARLGRAVAEVDPVPDEVRQAARMAFDTRDLDAELAVLVADSARDGADPDAIFDAVRAGEVADIRLLSFTGGGVQVDIEVNRTGGRLDLMGQLSGASGNTCFLEYPQEPAVEVELDDIGRFMVTGTPGGPVRLRCRSAAGTPVTTSWVTL